MVGKRVGQLLAAALRILRFLKILRICFCSQKGEKDSSSSLHLTSAILKPSIEVKSKISLIVGWEKKCQMYVKM